MVLYQDTTRKDAKVSELNGGARRGSQISVQLDDKHVSPTVTTDGAGRGSRLGAETAHPVGREDEELSILRNRANPVVGVKRL